MIRELYDSRSSLQEVLSTWRKGLEGHLWIHSAHDLPHPFFLSGPSPWSSMDPSMETAAPRTLLNKTIFIHNLHTIPQRCCSYPTPTPTLMVWPSF